MAVLLALAFPGYWAYQRWLASEAPEAAQSEEDRAHVLAVADDYAATLFAEEKWEEAAKAYRVLRERYLEANGGVHDEAAAVLLFNEAASELNRGRTRAGRALLLELAREAPAYQPEVIASLLEDTAGVTEGQEIDALATAASAAFDRADWPEAIRLFGEVLEALEAAGRPADDDRVSQTQYDRAMAYWNAEQYARAEELLRGIRTANPDYDPERIRQEHERVLELLEEEPRG